MLAAAGSARHECGGGLDLTELTAASERAGTFGRGGPGLYVPTLEASPCGRAETQPVERAVLLATPAVMPVDYVGETADMAGLAARSTPGDSSCTGTVFENGATDLPRTRQRV